MDKKKQFYQTLIENKFEIEEVKNIVIDSRLVEAGDIFFAIRGGNDYVEDVLKKKASLVFYDDEKIKIDDKRAIYVPDTIEFLQKTAKKYRTYMNPIVIGVTGSEGKTSTKDILYSILRENYIGKKTLGNYNNHIGLPLTLLRLEEKDQFIVLEMGMSNLGEIRVLGEIAQPDYGIITNIGDSHLEYLIDRDNVYKAKTELFEFVDEGKRIIYGDDPYFKNEKGIKIGEGKDNNIRLLNFTQGKEGSCYEIRRDKEKIEVRSNLYGKYNCINTLLSIATALELGMNLNDIVEKCKNLEITKQRFERIELDGKVFIDDAYNASPVAMELALKTFDEVFRGERKMVVLGDMLELGKESVRSHEGLLKTLEETKQEKVYLVGKEIEPLYKKIREGNYSFEVKYSKTVEEVKDEVRNLPKGSSIFLKASNGIKLNQIIK